MHVPVSTYSVEMQMDGSQHWQYVDTVRPTSQRVCHYELDELEPGRYTFRITPFNDVGAGPPALSAPTHVD